MKKNTIQSQEQSSSGLALNKILARSGLCSLRKAVEYIKSGLVKVGSDVITEPGYKVALNQLVYFKDTLVVQDEKIYFLLNKPKDCVTTVTDPQGRKTVIDLIKDRIKKTVHPVGRLDRLTTGLLILTNDGDLTQRLAHPKNQVKKIYDVVLDRPLNQEDYLNIVRGFELSDGFIKVDKLFYVPQKGNTHLKLELHSGKNRIVRRIFKHFGYNVLKLDRVNYAGLSKRGLPVGHWRRLDASEVYALKQYGLVVPKIKTQKDRNGYAKSEKKRTPFRSKTRKTK